MDHSLANRRIIAAIVTHFTTALEALGIPTYVEGQARQINTEWIEVRITSLRWVTHGQTEFCKLAVNLLSSTPSGENAVDVDFDLYRIEDMLGICENLLQQAISVDNMPCLIPATEAGVDMQQYRPRQIDAATNLRQASVTGFYKMEV